MNDNEFEGSIVLEQLANHGLVEDFYEAVDSDDIPRAVLLMRKAQVDEETIKFTVRKIQDQ